MTIKAIIVIILIIANQNSNSPNNFALNKLKPLILIRKTEQ